MAGVYATSLPSPDEAQPLFVTGGADGLIALCHLGTAKARATRTLRLLRRGLFVCFFVCYAALETVDAALGLSRKRL